MGRPKESKKRNWTWRRLPTSCWMERNQS